MNILVTGGSGFLGSHLADQLSEAGHKVTIYDKEKSRWLRTDQKMIIGDLLDVSSLEKAISEVEVVYHLAALANIDEAFKKPIQTIKVNIFGTALALEISRKHNIKRFIHASSIYVNSQDGGFYRCSKKAAEDYVEEYQKIYGLNYTILRYGSIYGERSDNTNGITDVIERALKTGKIIYSGTKKTYREYIHVLDVAKASVLILGDNFKNKHIILSGKKLIKVPDFLQILAKILSIKKNKIAFLNKKDGIHYEKTPFSYKFKKGKKLTLKSYINFNNGLTELVNKLKK